MSQNIGIASIMLLVCEHFKVSKENLLGPKRAKCIAKPRQIAMALCKEFTGASFPTVGLFFNRDHTTVIHACNAVKEMGPKGDLWYAAEYEALREIVKYKFGGMKQQGILDNIARLEPKSSFCTIGRIDMQSVADANRNKQIARIMNHPMAVAYRRNREGIAEDRLKVAARMAGKANFA